MALPDFAPYHTALAALHLLEPMGVVTRAVGLAMEAQGVNASIGDLCGILPRSGGDEILAEVVGFRDEALLLMPFGELRGVEPGSHVRRLRQAQLFPFGPGLLGRVIDALGRPIDGKGPLTNVRYVAMRTAPPAALERPPITEHLVTGVRVIDGTLTCGVGQRIGIFAGSGVGKSTLMGMIARGASAAYTVVGLVGERGREAQDFIDQQLGAEGMRRAVVVVATSDQPALLRLKAAWLATAVAEEMRAAGSHVLLLLDSVTRVALAQREIGLATGEPPALRGFTPSVFALLPRLLERSGTSAQGAMTAFYTVLVEGDDMNEPIADTVRGVLDGHIVLSRALAAENLYPAIDISQSISRLMAHVTTPAHQAAAARLRDALATYERHNDLIAIGAYVPGSNPAIDAALALHPKIQAFRRQSQAELEPFDRTLSALEAAIW
jgi:FliI/YscN family ATPase